MSSLFARASAGLTLTPWERAVLRFLEGLAASALMAGVTAIAPYMAGQAIDWRKVLSVFVTAAFMAVLLALKKYAKAFGDAPLPPTSGT